MNLYATLASGRGESTSAALAARLSAWHDAMVAHERRLRTRRTGYGCDEECPHVEARTLWAEALAEFGERAHELAFLRSRATHLAHPTANSVSSRSARSEGADIDRPPDRERKLAARDSRSRPVITPSLRPRRISAEVEL